MRQIDGYYGPVIGLFECNDKYNIAVEQVFVCLDLHVNLTRRVRQLDKDFSTSW